MKANELRIGNWVQKDLSIDDLITVKIKSGDLLMFDAECQDKESDFRTIFPIPLTEEWLERFEIKIDEWFGNFKLSKEDNTYYLQGSNTFTNVVITLTELKYVQELQNLYFALTGEELEIKTD